ncbi:MAG TPA: hypothetical protein VGR53_01590 [Nitrososphaerales archaeon]|nr:hypothetical protein [Nitrososphaerales archaeon]
MRTLVLGVVILVALGAVTSVVLLSSLGNERQVSPTLLKSIPLQGVAGRLDHMDADPTTHRLFLAAFGDGSILVVNLQNGSVTKVGGFLAPHGILFLQKYQHLYVTANNGSVYILSANTLSTVASIKLSSDTDNIRYDSTSDRILVAFGRGQNAGIGIIDPSSNTLISSVVLGAHPEAFQLDPAGLNVYANLPTLGVIARVSLSNMSVTAHWPVSGYLDNFPLAYDSKDRLVIIGTWFPATAIAYSPYTQLPVSHAAICSDADDLYSIPGTSSVLVSCGQGLVEVLQVSPGTMSISGTIPTGQGARTSFLSPDLNEYFVAVPESGNEPARILIFTVPSS